MTYLKIENNKGYFNKNVEAGYIWTEIDKIDKDDLFHLLNMAITDDFEMHEFKEELLGHKAHMIIYKSLYEKFADLLLNKTRFKDESTTMYKDAFEKYTKKD
jgi:hypothetical protein